MATVKMRSVKRNFRIRGFTLVELIVVITILAILATIGFLALSGYSQDAKDSAMKANVRSIQTTIGAESALNGVSPRFYVIHDEDYALSGALAYVDGTGTELTGGQYGTPGTNYSAGKPDFVKLKLNPDKFRMSWSPFGNTTVFATYDPTSAMAAGADFTTMGRDGKTRNVSFYQTAGISTITKIATVSGNFPQTDVAGYVSGLIRAYPGNPSSLTGALTDGQSGFSVPRANCTLPWGGTLADGETVSAYSTGIVNEPATCPSVAVSLSCSNGTLSHPNAANSCVMKDPSKGSVVMHMHMAGNVTDVKGKSVTNNGGVSASAGTGPWGGDSLYFNGATNAQLTIPDSGDFYFASGDVTIESFVYWDGTVRPTYNAISLWGQNCSANSNMRLILGSGGGLTGYASSDSSAPVSTANGVVPVNQWAHIAYSKQGSAYRIFVNGTKVAENLNGPSGLADIACSWQIGNEESVAISLKGYMAEFRITKGVARYTANFAPPTGPYPEN